MTQIEIAAPACLPLALARLADGSTSLLAAALQYPPVNLYARPGAGLEITGARADRATELARHFLRHHGLREAATVEIELAIPSLMGLSSDAMLGLALGQALSWVHGLPLEAGPGLAASLGLEPNEAHAVHGYASGGVVLVETPAASASPRLLRRHALVHPEEDAWAFVIVMPRLSAGARETLEADRLAHWLASAPGLDVESGRLLEAELWPAMLRDDIEGFGRALLALQELNARALAGAGMSVPPGDEAQGLLGLCREHGAVAWGSNPTGLGLYALIRGPSPSVALRERLTERLGLFGGTVMASTVDPWGGRHAVYDEGTFSYAGASTLVTRNLRPPGSL